MTLWVDSKRLQSCLLIGSMNEPIPPCVRAITSLPGDRVGGNMETSAFTMKPDDDSAKHESVCTKCSMVLTAYTLESLAKKQVSHICRDRPPMHHPRRPANVPRQKLY